MSLSKAQAKRLTELEARMSVVEQATTLADESIAKWFEAYASLPMSEQRRTAVLVAAGQAAAGELRSEEAIEAALITADCRAGFMGPILGYESDQYGIDFDPPPRRISASPAPAAPELASDWNPNESPLYAPELVPAAIETVAMPPAPLAPPPKPRRSKANAAEWSNVVEEGMHRDCALSSGGEYYLRVAAPNLAVFLPSGDDPRAPGSGIEVDVAIHCRGEHALKVVDFDGVDVGAIAAGSSQHFKHGGDVEGWAVKAPPSPPPGVEGDAVGYVPGPESYTW